MKEKVNSKGRKTYGKKYKEMKVRKIWVDIRQYSFIYYILFDFKKIRKKISKGSNFIKKIIISEIYFFSLSNCLAIFHVDQGSPWKYSWTKSTKDWHPTTRKKKKAWKRRWRRRSWRRRVQNSMFEWSQDTKHSKMSTDTQKESQSCKFSQEEVIRVALLWNYKKWGGRLVF